MAKFKVGDRCRVIKNALAPKCIGQIVEIVGVQSEKDGRVLYKIAIDTDGKTLDGYASEGCLELVSRQSDMVDSFAMTCETYRAMYAGAKDDKYLKERINQFRSGKTNW